MTIKRIDSNARMSEAVIHGNTVYLAGQIAEGETVAEQARGALAEVDAMLAKAGTDKSKILQTLIYLADINDFDASIASSFVNSPSKYAKSSL